MATLVILLSIATSVLAAVLGVLNIREKLWPKPVTPHPLQAPLYEIAAAIRESREEV